MRRFLTAVTFVLIFAASAHAQDEWYIGKPIAGFTFVGLENISESELQPIVRPYVGQTFSLDVFWEIQEKLYALDYFQSIESNALAGDEQKSSVIVEFRVKEKPVVSEIVLEGNRKLRRSEILDRILIKRGDMASQAKVNADAEAISGLYLEKGYMDVQVTGSIEPVEGENRVTVNFAIVEGLQTTIRSINFTGNSFASDSSLRKVMKTKPQALFSSGVFQEAKFQEDLQRLVDYYGEHGYVDAKVEKVDRQIERDEKEGRNTLNITIHISEGQQWTYGGMSFEGNHIFSDGELANLVRQTPGKILNKTRLEADTARVADLYYENGYIFNVINRQEARDPKKQEISYVINIVENDRAHIQKIILKGNEKTKDYVIFRELPFEEGDIFSKGKVLQGLRNLYNLQYFTAVTPETPPGDAEGLMDLVINVEEGSTAAINFGVMFAGGDYPISGMLKWEEKNFLGRGQSVGVNLELSPLRQLVSLSFEEPWMFGYRWLGGVNFSLEHSVVPNVLQDVLPPVYNGDETNAAPDPYPDKAAYDAAIADGLSVPDQYTMDYTMWKVSAGLTTGYRYQTALGWLGVRSFLNTSLQQISYDPALYRPFDPLVRAGQGVWKNVNKLGFTGYWDRRDYFLNPSSGTYLSQGVTFALGFPIGTRQYIRTDSTAEAFLTLFDVPVTDNWSFKTVLAAHSALSLILPQFGSPKALAITDDLLYVDGWNVARGWPLERDKKALWDNKLELRMPIAEQILWGVMFFDAVAAYDEIDQMRSMNLDDFYFSFGAGLRFSIPQFPIRLYLAKRFRTDNGQVVWPQGNLPIGSTSLDFVISIGGDTF